VLDENIPDEQAATADHELLVAERNDALREAFARLPPGGQRLLALLIADPPVPYAEISARLGISVGSIGPNRGRYLDKLRRDPAIAALINAEAASVTGQTHGQSVRSGASVTRDKHHGPFGQKDLSLYRTGRVLPIAARNPQGRRCK
jgi:hypothetical protein